MYKDKFQIKYKLQYKLQYKLCGKNIYKIKLHYMDFL